VFQCKYSHSRKSPECAIKKWYFYFCKKINFSAQLYYENTVEIQINLDDLISYVCGKMRFSIYFFSELDSNSWVLVSWDWWVQHCKTFGFFIFRILQKYFNVSIKIIQSFLNKFVGKKNGNVCRLFRFPTSYNAALFRPSKKSLFTYKFIINNFYKNFYFMIKVQNL
jgi:hypothetical protein